MLAPEVKRLIQTCAAFNARVAQKAGELDFLIWASPTACRNPDSTSFWHPFFLKKSLIVHLFVYAYSAIRYSWAGFLRFFHYRGFWFRFHEEGGSMIVVMPEEITDGTAAGKTSYLIESETILLDKLVFSQSKPIGHRYSCLNRGLKFSIPLRLLSLLCGDFKKHLFQRKIDKYYLAAVMLFFRWILSQGWYFHWDFYHLIDEILDARKHRYKIALSLHEMYFYARTFWNLAKKYQLTRVTAQHALIVPERLVWFREADEIAAGCPAPDRFFVYNEESLEMFRPYFPDTTFLFCCSPRFNRWKAEILRADGPAGGGPQNDSSTDSSEKTILIIGSMMSFDVKILARMMKRLFQSTPPEHLKIRLRLHPHSDMNLRDRLWIRSASKKGVITLSKSSLKEDFAMASLVIGCNTAALPESILLGIPTLTVFDEGYICPTMIEQSEAWEVSVNKISWERLLEQIKRPPNEALVRRFKNKMGLSYPDLTTELIVKHLRDSSPHPRSMATMPSLEVPPLAPLAL